VRPGAFIKGPIPLPWILTAMRLRGSALHVGIFIRYLAGLTSSRTVKLRLGSIPISRGAASRGLTTLERAGLVRVKRTRGHWPRVTILESGGQR